MGDATDAGELFRTHERLVRRVLARYGVASADMADLLQEVFLVAHRRGGYHAGPAKPGTWLAAIAIRVASDHRRRRERRAGREEIDPQAVSQASTSDLSPGDAAALTERLRRVRRALRRVTPPKRVVFVQFEIEGRSCAEIATALRVPVGTVYSRLHDARRQFLQAYQCPETLRPMAMGDTTGRSNQ